MQKIKILQIITGLFPGGAERVVLELQSRINPDEFESRIITLSQDTRALKVFGHTDVEPKVYDLSGANGLINIYKLRKHTLDYRPDIIHAHMFHGLIAAVCATIFQVHRPAICFTSHLDNYPALRRLIVKLLRQYRDADIIFSPQQHEIMNTGNTRIIPNGVFVPKSMPRRSSWSMNRDIKLLAVGRLTDQKDPLGLINSIKKLAIPSIRLDFVGEGPLESEIRKAVQENGLNDQIRLLGLRNDVSRLMKDYDILVMHSKYEGMPITLLEAGAQAMPVVSTRAGSIPFLLDGGCGSLCSREDFPIALRNAISNPEMTLDTGKKLYERVSKEYSASGMTKAHERLYTELFQTRNMNNKKSNKSSATSPQQ